MYSRHRYETETPIGVGPYSVDPGRNAANLNQLLGAPTNYTEEGQKSGTPLTEVPFYTQQETEVVSRNASFAFRDRWQATWRESIVPRVQNTGPSKLKVEFEWKAKAAPRAVPGTPLTFTTFDSYQWSTTYGWNGAGIQIDMGFFWTESGMKQYARSFEILARMIEISVVNGMYNAFRNNEPYYYTHVKKRTDINELTKFHMIARIFQSQWNIIRSVDMAPFPKLINQLNLMEAEANIPQTTEIITSPAAAEYLKFTEMNTMNTTQGHLGTKKRQGINTQADSSYPNKIRGCGIHYQEPFIVGDDGNLYDPLEKAHWFGEYYVGPNALFSGSSDKPHNKNHNELDIYDAHSDSYRTIHLESVIESGLNGLDATTKAKLFPGKHWFRSPLIDKIGGANAIDRMRALGLKQTSFEEADENEIYQSTGLNVPASTTSVETEMAKSFIPGPFKVNAKLASGTIVTNALQFVVSDQSNPHYAHVLKLLNYFEPSLDYGKGTKTSFVFYKDEAGTASAAAPLVWENVPAIVALDFILNGNEYIGIKGTDTAPIMNFFTDTTASPKVFVKNPWYKSHCKPLSESDWSKDVYTFDSYTKYYLGIFSMVSNSVDKMRKYVKLSGPLGLNYVLLRLGLAYRAQDNWRLLGGGETMVMSMGRSVGYVDDDYSSFKHSIGFYQNHGPEFTNPRAISLVHGAFVTDYLNGENTVMKRAELKNYFNDTKVASAEAQQAIDDEETGGIAVLFISSKFDLNNPTVFVENTDFVETIQGKDPFEHYRSTFAYKDWDLDSYTSNLCDSLHKANDTNAPHTPNRVAFKGRSRFIDPRTNEIVRDTGNSPWKEIDDPKLKLRAVRFGSHQGSKVAFQ